MESTELRGHRNEAERLPIGASSDTNQDEGDTSTRESKSAGDAVKPVLCPIDHQVWCLIISLRKIRVCKVMLCQLVMR